MVRKLILLTAALALAALGLIGLVLPVLPGLLLLAAAAGCLSLASTRFGRHLERRARRHPRYRRVLARWQAGRGLPAWQRLRLGFYLTLASVLPAPGPGASAPRRSRP